MKEHRGMRPHDIVVLLKIAALQDEKWYNKDLAYALGISQSEVSESLNRSRIAGLIDDSKKKLMREAILEFIAYGLKFVYPEAPGAIARGMPTAHSAAPMNKLINSEEIYVWPNGQGEARGQIVQPLHPNVVEACRKDPMLYEYLVLVDVIRVGRAREINLAIKELRARLHAAK